MLPSYEYHAREPLPLHRVHDAILDFCRGRDDAVVFGAQAVNLYVGDPRMSQDVDILSPRPANLAEDLARHLGTLFHAAVRVRRVGGGKGFRVYQVRGEGPRHLADVRLAEAVVGEATERDGIRYVPLVLLVALKVRALARRRLAPKGATDLADLRRLLLANPHLRAVEGPVAETLRRIGAGEADLAAWRDVVEEPAVSDEEADEGY